MILVDLFNKNRAGYLNVNLYIEDERWISLISDASVKVSFVGRDYLKGADALANKGSESAGMHIAWC